MRLCINDRVTWGQGRNRKTGYVIAVILADENPNWIIGHLEAVYGTTRSSARVIQPRDHESYVVLVPRSGIGGKPLKAKLFWPRASSLTVLEQTGAPE